MRCRPLREGDIGGDGFGETVEAAVVFEVGLVNGEEGVAEQGQSADEIGISAAGMVLALDHSIPPDVSYENFMYFFKRKKEMLGI